MTTRRPIDPASALAGAAFALALALLVGFRAQDEPATPDVRVPGRYAVAVGQDMNALVLVDTATGSTWRWQDPEVRSEWRFVEMAAGPPGERR